MGIWVDLGSFIFFLRQLINMSRNILAVLFSVIWTFVIILALTWGTEYIWPDYVHVDYGFPLVWGVHVLNTIHGPVDFWRVNMANLFLDLTIWLGIFVGVLFLILYVKKSEFSYTPD
ncbi:MAG: hypothetical protein QW717_02740 [Candidatus Bathyarchaeia archaeon]